MLPATDRTLRDRVASTAQAMSDQWLELLQRAGGEFAFRLEPLPIGASRELQDEHSTRAIITTASIVIAGEILARDHGTIVALMPDPQGWIVRKVAATEGAHA